MVKESDMEHIYLKIRQNSLENGNMIDQNQDIYLPKIK